MDLYWFLLGGCVGAVVVLRAQEYHRTQNQRLEAVEARVLPAPETVDYDEVEARHARVLAEAFADSLERRKLLVDAGAR